MGMEFKLHVQHLKLPGSCETYDYKAASIQESPKEYLVFKADQFKVKFIHVQAISNVPFGRNYSP